METLRPKGVPVIANRKRTGEPGLTVTTAILLPLFSVPKVKVSQIIHL